MSFPFANALAQLYPNDKIIAVVEPILVPLIKRLNPNFIIWAYGKKMRKELFLALKNEKPESCYLLTNSLGSFMPYFKARIPNRIGHGGKFTRFLLTQSFYASTKTESQGVRNLQLLPSQNFKPIKGILDYKKNSTENPHLILFPGAKYGDSKKWSALSYANVAERMLEKKWNVTLLGTNDEKKDTEEILKAMPNRTSVHNLCGSLNIEELLDWLGKNNNLIALANDSGAFHMMSACGIPSLGLYFSTSAEATPPAFGNFKVIQADIECRPCFARECPKKHYNCRTKISPEQVAKELFLLSESL